MENRNGEEVAALPMVPHNNTGGSSNRNLNQLNLFQSDAYQNLVIDVIPDFITLTKFSKLASTRAKYKLFRAPVDSTLFCGIFCQERESAGPVLHQDQMFDH